VILLENSN
jgi:hypothetical protein